MSPMTGMNRRLSAGKKLAKAKKGIGPSPTVFVCGEEVRPTNRLTWKSRRQKLLNAGKKKFKPQPKVIRATQLTSADAQRCSHETLRRYPVSEIGRKAPTCPGLYFIYQQSQLIYVGQASKNLRSRLSGHEVIRIIGRWEPSKTMSFAFIAVLDGENLFQAEYHFIKSLKPVLNSDPFENIAALNQRRVS
jgi:hypothetical protein